MYVHVCDVSYVYVRTSVCVSLSTVYMMCVYMYGCVYVMSDMCMIYAHVYIYINVCVYVSCVSRVCTCMYVSDIRMCACVCTHVCVCVRVGIRETLSGI